MARKFSPIVALALVFAMLYDPDYFQPESIRGKRILITGASSGIGEELAYQYSKLGASVVITARRENLLQKVAAKCRELGAKQVEVVAADLGRPEDRQRIVSETQKRLGGVDHLILNHMNTKISLYYGSAENVSNLRQELEAHFFSYVDIASKALPMLITSQGNIGVVSSVAGKVGMPSVASYAGNKFALHGFFSSLRQELKQRSTGVSVTLCVLGYIDTETAVSHMTTHHKDSLQWMPAPAATSDAATAIMKGVTKEAYEMYYPRSAKFTVILHKFIPGYVEDFLGSYVNMSS